MPLMTLFAALVVAGLLVASASWGTKAAQVPADEVLKDFMVERVIDDRSLEISIAKGPRGRWRAVASSPIEGVQEGQKGRIRLPRSTLEARKGPAHLGFKGSDEELQAVIEFLGLGK